MIRNAQIRYEPLTPLQDAPRSGNLRTPLSSEAGRSLRLMEMEVAAKTGAARLRDRGSRAPMSARRRRDFIRAMLSTSSRPRPAQRLGPDSSDPT